MGGVLLDSFEESMLQKTNTHTNTHERTQTHARAHTHTNTLGDVSGLGAVLNAHYHIGLLQKGADSL